MEAVSSLGKKKYVELPLLLAHTLEALKKSFKTAVSAQLFI